VVIFDSFLLSSFIVVLQHTYGFTNLLEYHGSGAFNLTIYPEWDSILQDMTSRPSEVVIVSARRRGGGHGGWSKDNPYLEDVSRVPM
jgi:hypothetical protein